MSGGVDSSVAAALMLDQGFDVVGVTLKQWEGADGLMPVAGCCTLSDAEDARRVAAQLDTTLDHMCAGNDAPGASAQTIDDIPNTAACVPCPRASPRSLTPTDFLSIASTIGAALRGWVRSREHKWVNSYER